MPRLSHPAHTAPSTCQTHRTLSWISVLASQPIYIGSDTSSGFPLSQVVVFCMVVELKGGGASVSPRGRVADGEASPRRARACHSKDLRKLSPLSSRLFPFPFVELLCVLVDVLEVPMQMSPLLGELACCWMHSPRSKSGPWLSMSRLQSPWTSLQLWEFSLPDALSSLRLSSYLALCYL